MRPRKRRTREVARFRTSRRDIKQIRRIVVTRSLQQRGDKRGEA